MKRLNYIDGLKEGQLWPNRKVPGEQLYRTCAPKQVIEQSSTLDFSIDDSRIELGSNVHKEKSTLKP